MDAALASLLLIQLVDGAPAWPDTPPISRPEARAMQPEILARRLFGDMGRILLPLSNRRNLREVEEPLQRLAWLTRARTNITGVCATQRLELSFGLVYPQLSGLPSPTPSATSPVRPAGLDVTSFYFVINPTLNLNYETEPRPRHLASVDCYRADPRRAVLIEAASPELVRDGLIELLPVVDAAKTGRAFVPLDCHGLTLPGDPPMTEERCLAAAARLEPARVEQVERCGDFCITLILPQRRVRIRREAYVLLPRRVEIEWAINRIDEPQD